MLTETERTLTKTQMKKLKRSQKGETTERLSFVLHPITPMTDNQRKVFNDYENGYNLLLLGCPGTGKSFLSLYLSLRQVFSEKTDARKVVIIRSAQSSKSIGYRPCHPHRTKLHHTAA